jgi:transposase-like protein
MRKGRNERLTAKQRYWLEHVRACEESGQVLAKYAASHDLGVGQLYSWRTRLRKRGLLGDSASPRRSGPKRGTAPAGRTSGKRSGKLGFTAVRVVTPESGGDLRIRFRNGILLEFASSFRGVPDAQLLAMLAALP